VDDDEMEIARRMIARGADVNVKAAVDADDFARLRLKRDRKDLRKWAKQW